MDMTLSKGPGTVVRCWYCGRVNPWFACECLWSREVREGKRARPQFIEDRGGRTVVILDEETVARNPLGLPRYRASVSSEPVLAGAVSTAATEKRRAYMRELMRKKRSGGPSKQERK